MKSFPNLLISNVSVLVFNFEMFVIVKLMSMFAFKGFAVKLKLIC